MTTTATPQLARPGIGRLHALRLVAGYGLVAGTIPYLSLKIAWLSGSTIGITDPGFAQDSSLAVLNMATAGMDFVAILVALALTHQWGQRLPPWLVLAPMFVGTGLLAPIAVGTPLQVLAAAFAPASGHSASSTGLPLEPWVQPMVYAGFTWQGVTLLTAFVLYARVRWPAAFRPWRAVPGATYAAQVAVANGGAALAVAVAALHLYWAFGGNAGLSDQAAAAQSIASSLTSGVHGVLGIVAAAGVLGMVHRARVPFWLPLTAAWVGSAALLSWGLWSMVNVLGGTVLTNGGAGMALAHLHGLAKVLAGLTLALASLFLLAERGAHSN